MKDPKKEAAAKAKAEQEEAAAKAKAEEEAAAKAKAEEEAAKAKDRAVKSGMVHCRVRGPAPMMTEEGVKAAGETFHCSAQRAKAYGKLVEPAKEFETEDSE